MFHDVSSLAARRPTSGALADRDVERAWARLDGFARLPTQRWGFALALAATLLADAEITVLVAAGAGGAMAMLPICRDRGWLARWRMLGAREVFEPGDLLCADAEGADALARQIAAQPRAAAFDRVPATSPLVPALVRAMRGRGLVRVRPAVACPTIALNEAWHEPEQCFNSGRRSDFRRAARRAAELGEVTCEVLSPCPAEFDALFDEAIAVEARGWKTAAGTAIAVDRAKEAFFRDYLRQACTEGTCRVAFLRIDGQAAAMQLALEWNGRFWLYKIGFDENFARCSPGTLLMLHTLGWAAARKLTAYELMGNVEGWIADFWTRESHACLRVTTYPFNLRGALAFAVDAVDWVRGRLRTVVRR